MKMFGTCPKIHNLQLINFLSLYLGISPVLYTRVWSLGHQDTEGIKGPTVNALLVACASIFSKHRNPMLLLETVLKLETMLLLEYLFPEKEKLIY